MIETAENLAQDYKITREEADVFAARVIAAPLWRGTRVALDRR